MWKVTVKRNALQRIGRGWGRTLAARKRCRLFGAQLQAEREHFPRRIRRREGPRGEIGRSNRGVALRIVPTALAPCSSPAGLSVLRGGSWHSTTCSGSLRLDVGLQPLAVRGLLLFLRDRANTHSNPPPTHLALPSTLSRSREASTRPPIRIVETCRLRSPSIALRAPVSAQPTPALRHCTLRRFNDCEIFLDTSACCGAWSLRETAGKQLRRINSLSTALLHPSCLRFVDGTAARRPLFLSRDVASYPICALDF